MEDVRYPERKNPRMRHYDYATPGYYFVTFCTNDRKCIFGQAQRLNHFGKEAQKALEEVPKHFPGVVVDKYVVMPNHIHAIIILTGNDVHLSAVIGSCKACISKEVHKVFPDLKVWQASFHDHVIRNQKAYEHIWLYIAANPQRWEDDCFYV